MSSVTIQPDFYCHDHIDSFAKFFQEGPKDCFKTLKYTAELADSFFKDTRLKQMTSFFKEGL